jgi:voltage-gated potassium channel
MLKKIIRSVKYYPDKYLILLLAMILMMASSTFFEDTVSGHIFFSGIITLVLLAELYADQSNKLINHLPEMILGAVALLMTWVQLYDTADKTLIFYSTLSYGIYFFYATYILIKKIALAKQITLNIFYASMAGYLLLGILGGIFATLTEISYPNSYKIEMQTKPYHFENFLYYSFITLTTVGYGDILPVKPLAKTLAILLATFGQMYMTIIMAMLIGKYLNNTQK